ncbi:DUF883 family protein [Hydrogenophaga electricum]|uniref:DUF883 domain-containing protein n=1 Tax=Hydrogenophaga electricum TaxID=1230953 RepID=A0ABQ6C3R9_9BURK|nr:DUF883 family protein [Hydrogenophaga electricum]GLS14273.1 hypothetical protein GCM10007935_17040 [Hydrogenophaga electricum]
MPRKSAAASQTELENLIADLRDVLARKELDVLPEISSLRERLEDGVHTVRERASQVAHDAAEHARDAAHRVDTYAHDEPWRVASVALAVGAVFGFLIGRR